MVYNSGMSDPQPGTTVNAKVNWIHSVVPNMLFLAPTLVGHPFPCTPTSITGDGGQVVVLQILAPPNVGFAVGLEFELLEMTRLGQRVIATGAVTPPPGA
jgi:hypothetical protein